jgi:tRNA U55 pseudouridine synthase TruB
MKLIYKKLGQTPLEALQELRVIEPVLKEEILSYIGRLDPMAEGEMIILVGREENQRRKEFLNFDKEYVAEFLIGFSTDTGDLLGIVENNFFEKVKTVGDLKTGKESELIKNKIANLPVKFQQIPVELLKITHQKFPWFSSRHVLGRALFDWFKTGRAHEIERPSKNIKIYSAELGHDEEISATELLQYLTENINKVKGDFRQAEILQKWQGILHSFISQKSVETIKSAETISNFPIAEFPVFTIKLKVSTGTYIRGLTEEIEKVIGAPVVLFSLRRDKIFLDN